MQLPETLGGLVVETGPGFFPALKNKYMCQDKRSH